MPQGDVLQGAYRVFHSTSQYVTTPEFHSHDFYELYFYLSGSASIVIEEFVYPLHPGDVVLLPPGRIHRAVHHAQRGYYDRYLIYACADFLQRAGTPDFSMLNLLDAAAAQSHFVAHPPGEELLRALTSMNELISATDADAQQALINDCMLTMVLARLCRWFSAPVSADASGTPHPLSDVISYINTHLAEDLSLDALSARFAVNKYHLLRAFKDYAQVTLHQYILQKRINCAKDLLRTGTPPSQAYPACGFYDYSSFYKSFKKHTGMAPQQYAHFASVIEH